MHGDFIGRAQPGGGNVRDSFGIDENVLYITFGNGYTARGVHEW